MPSTDATTEPEKWELNEVRETDYVLKTDIQKCLVCGVGDVKPHVRGTEKNAILIYSRNGTYKVQHEVYICNFKNKHKQCRTSYFHGYYKVKRAKIIEDMALKNEVLVVTNQTGFELDYLIEMVSQIEINSDNFEGLSKVYNRFHNQRLPMELMKRREDLCRKRMTEAYFLFLYVYLELGQRYSIPNYQVIHGDLDNAILKHQEEFQITFRKKWFTHRCDVPGC